MSIWLGNKRLDNSLDSLADVATSGDYNDLKNKPTAGTGITISSNVISTSYPEVYLTQEEYNARKAAGTLDPNTYYNTLATSAQFSTNNIITIKPSMSQGEILAKGCMVLVEA